jgi:phospholipid-hydroperoxide glutathione peroxidase
MANGGNGNWKKASSVYEFTVTDIDGNVTPLDKYKGNVLLIVNVASKWGKTNVNYTQLQALHEKYAQQNGLRILAFPCNQFGSQEPGTESEIKEFIKKFNVQFDMFSKIKVNGDDAEPLYKYLKSKQGGLLGSFIKWNFTKFLVDKNGRPVKRYGPNEDPFSFEKDLHKYF